MNKENVKTLIEAGKAVVGIELGSTRIKAVMIDENHQPVATGSYDWENRLDGHIWTYDLEDIWKGLKASYANMAADVKEKYGTEIKSLAGIGFSAMMHGYMAFDKEGDTACSIPYLEKYDHRTGSRRADRAVPVQHSAEMEHCTSVSGDS